MRLNSLFFSLIYTHVKLTSYTVLNTISFVSIDHIQTQNRFPQSNSDQMSMQQPQQRRMSMSPRRFIEREQSSKSNNNTKITTNGISPMNNYYEQQIKKNNHNQQQTMNDQYTGNFFDMDSSIDQKLKYIQHMEYEFDMLMKHKQQLDAKLTRIPYKTTNTNMQSLRESVESELDMVEKKLNSVKLELRKLNIIKSH
jgi:hypothetical protein